MRVKMEEGKKINGRKKHSYDNGRRQKGREKKNEGNIFFKRKKYRKKERKKNRRRWF